MRGNGLAGALDGAAEVRNTLVEGWTQWAPQHRRFCRILRAGLLRAREISVVRFGQVQFRFDPGLGGGRGVHGKVGLGFGRVNRFGRFDVEFPCSALVDALGQAIGRRPFGVRLGFGLIGGDR